MYDSEGIIENKRNVALGIKFNFDTKEIYTLNLFINNFKVEPNEIFKNNDTIIFELSIDKNLENTIASWSYLRDKTQDYLSIDFNKVGTRIKEPNIIKLEIEIYGNNYTYIKKFDNINDYRENVGYIFDGEGLNDINNCYKLGEWI